MHLFAIVHYIFLNLFTFSHQNPFIPTCNHPTPVRDGLFQNALFPCMCQPQLRFLFILLFNCDFKLQSIHADLLKEDYEWVCFLHTCHIINKKFFEFYKNFSNSANKILFSNSSIHNCQSISKHIFFFVFFDVCLLYIC